MSIRRVYVGGTSPCYYVEVDGVRQKNEAGFDKEFTPAEAKAFIEKHKAAEAKATVPPAKAKDVKDGE